MTNKTVTMSQELAAVLADEHAPFQHLMAAKARLRELLAAPVVERQPVAHRLEFEDGQKTSWIDGAPTEIDIRDVEDGVLKGIDLAYAEQPAPVAVDDSTTSDKYRAELYDEVWQKARDMGFANVTDALERLNDIDGCPRIVKVKELNQ